MFYHSVHANTNSGAHGGGDTGGSGDNDSLLSSDDIHVVFWFSGEQGLHQQFFFV